MAATVTIDYVIDEMREQNLNCWSVMDGKNLLSEQDDPRTAMDESIQMLINKIRPIRSSTILVRLSGVSRRERKGAESHKVRTYIVDLRDSVDPVGNKAPVAISGPSSAEHKLREELLALRTQIIKAEYQSKIDELEKRIKAMESEEDEDGISGIAKQLMPLLVNAFSAQPAASAGSSPALAGLPVDGAELLAQWQALDPQALDVLQKIVSLAKNRPDMYATYKPIILSA